MMYAHLLEPPPKVTEKRPDLPPEVDEVIETALAKSRDDRYPSAGALATAFRNALGTGVRAATVASGQGAQETVLATSPSLAVAAAAAGGGAEPGGEPPSGSKGSNRRRRLVLAGLGGLAI